MKVQIVKDNFRCTSKGFLTSSVVTWAELTETWSSYTNPWSFWDIRYLSDIMKVSIKKNI